MVNFIFRDDKKRVEDNKLFSTEINQLLNKNFISKNVKIINDNKKYKQPTEKKKKKLIINIINDKYLNEYNKVDSLFNNEHWRSKYDGSDRSDGSDGSNGSKNKINNKNRRNDDKDWRVIFKDKGS